MSQTPLIKALPRQGESEKTMKFQHVKPKVCDADLNKSALSGTGGVLRK